MSRQQMKTMILDSDRNPIMSYHDKKINVGPGQYNASYSQIDVNHNIKITNGSRSLRTEVLPLSGLHVFELNPLVGPGTYQAEKKKKIRGQRISLLNRYQYKTSNWSDEVAGFITDKTLNPAPNQYFRNYENQTRRCKSAQITSYKTSRNILALTPAEKLRERNLQMKKYTAEVASYNLRAKSATTPKCGAINCSERCIRIGSSFAVARQSIPETPAPNFYNYDGNVGVKGVKTINIQSFGKQLQGRGLDDDYQKQMEIRKLRQRIFEKTIKINLCGGDVDYNYLQQEKKDMIQRSTSQQKSTNRLSKPNNVIQKFKYY